MDAGELDALPFGVIELDRDGTIVRINEPEARRTNRAPEAFIGRNFFTDVAPCADVREFAGKFRRGVRRGQLRKLFPFTYRTDVGDQQVYVFLLSVYPDKGWVLATLAEPEKP